MGGDGSEPAVAAGVTALTVDSAVLNLFWELASVHSAKREVAAKQLVAELRRAQQEFEAAGPGAETETSGGTTAPLVSYAMRRLTRGLASGREGARQGFALAFSGALLVLPCVSASAALEILHTYSEPITGSLKGAEAREIFLGKLFGLGAIAHSMHVAGSGAQDATVLARLMQETASLSRKKGYMREAGAAILLELLDGVNAKTLGAVLDQAPAFAEWLFSPVESADAEALLLAMQLVDRLSPKLVARCALVPPAGLRAVFEKQHLQALLPLLLASTSAHPRVHSVWSSLIDLLLQGYNSSQSAHRDIETFWDVACENSLFASSHERKFLGFKLFETLLPRLRSDDVSVLFSQQFMRCMVNSLTNKDTLLHSSASVCLSNLLAYVQSEEGAALQTSVIAALQRFAGGRFDRLTQTGTISALMESLAPASADDYVGALFISFLSGTPVGRASDDSVPQTADDAADLEDAQRRVNGRRIWAIEQLCGLCRSPRTPTDVVVRVMRFLLVHACYDFVPGGNAAGSSMEALQLGGPAPVLAPEVRQMCATRLGGLIADSLTAATATIRTSADLSDPSAAEAAAADAVLRKQRATDCSTHLAQLTELFTKAERAHALVQLSQPLEAPAAAVRKAVCALLPALDRLAAADAAGGRSGTGTQADSARALLRVLLIMQLGAPQDYTPDMEDLPQCLRAAFPAAGFPADAAAVPEAADAEEPPHHMDVLVEVLLSLLAKPSAVLRDVVERVFRAFAADVTPEGVRSMLRVVTRSKGRRHSSAAASDSDDDSESDEDDAGDGEDEEEVEEDGEDGEDDSDGEQAQQPSRSGAQPRAAAAGSDDSDSDDGAGMDDEAMFKTDAALAAVLSLSKAEKTKKKTAAEALTHFKFRVLSLLELFIKAQPSSPLIPSLVVPLLRALIAVVQGPSASEMLADRISGLLVKAVCKAPVAAASRGSALSHEELQSWFTKCLRHASRSTVPKVAKAAAAACQYLLRVLASAGPDGAAAVSPLLRAAAADYFASKKCRLPYAFIVFALERFPAVKGSVVDDMMAHVIATLGKDALNARDEFLVVEALKLTAEALRHKAGSPEAAAAAAGLQPTAVLRGVTLALGMRCSKAKRQGDVYKHAVRSADALRRFCESTKIALPAAEVDALRGGIAGAKASDSARQPKIAGQLDRLLNEYAAVKQGGVKRPAAAHAAAAPAAAREKAKRQKALRAVHLLRCPDQRGLLARITQLAARAGPLLNCEVHIEVPSGADCGSSTAEFHSRTEFAYDPEAWPRDKMEADFTTLAAELGATRSKLHVPRLDPRPRLGVLVSQIDHCLTELLHRWEGGELPVELTCVISNHQRERNSYVSRFLERHGVPLYFVPAGRSVAAGQMRSHEPAILSLVHRTDFLVLARYMQVLSGRFLNEYSRDVINIHHGLLPSFKGANPYRQAYDAGVKVIGATSHFVTEELDGGPIIEQMVERVTHRDTLQTFADKSRTLEKNCLFHATRLYVEERVVRCKDGSRVAVLH